MTTFDTADTLTPAEQGIARSVGDFARRMGAVRMLRPPTGPTGIDDLDQAVTNYRRLVAEHRTARDELRRLEDARAKAAEADRDAWANALTAGNDKDPGQTQTRKADEALDTQRRKTAALASAVDLAVTSVFTTISTHQADITQETRQRADTAAADAGSAIAALADATGRLTAARAVQRWISDPSRGYVETPIPTALKKINDAPYTAADLVAALRRAFTGSA